MAEDELGIDRLRRGIGEIRERVENAVARAAAIDAPASGSRVGEWRVESLASDLRDLTGLLHQYGITGRPGGPKTYGVFSEPLGSDYVDVRGFTHDDVLPEREQELEERFTELVGDRGIDPWLRQHASDLIPPEHMKRGTASVAARRDLQFQVERQIPIYHYRTERTPDDLRSVASELAAAVLSRHSRQAVDALRQLEQNPRLPETKLREKLASTVLALQGHAGHAQEGVAVVSGRRWQRKGPDAVAAATRSLATGPAADDTPTVELPPRDAPGAGQDAPGERFRQGGQPPGKQPPRAAR